MGAPDYLTAPDFTFAGQPLGKGVNPVFATILAAVEADLVQKWSAEGSVEDFATWAGLSEPIIGWRSGAGLHGSGSAVDINYTTNPYIVVRTGATLGGEAAAAEQVGMRQLAVEVYDRAVAFFVGDGQQADVSIRVHDTIEVTYDRFRLVSDALSYYFGWVFSAASPRIDRPPIQGVSYLPDGDPGFSAIPDSEFSWDQATAIAQLESLYADEDWASLHQNLLPPDQQYWQIVRDYELVRIPMLFGSPTEPIRSTRNPCRGFLDLRRELVVSMITIGDQILGRPRSMRWGASDFGANESGDVMHFDLGSHRGFTPQ